MMRIIVALARAKQAAVLEAAGMAAVVYGAAQIRPWAAWLAAGAGLLAKSLEVDLRPPTKESDR